MALFQVRRLDILKLAFFVEIIAGLRPGLCFVDFSECAVHSVDVLGDLTDHIGVKEELAFELCIVEEHNDESHGGYSICGQSQRVELFKLLKKRS